MTHLSALEPRDEHNLLLESHVHPPAWDNPQPAGRYNLVVVGAGTAGLVAAAGAAGMGARVALVERGLMGGDCLNVGCVPSKALLRSARAVAACRSAGSFGVALAGTPEVEFAQVMERMRRLRAGISPHDSAHRFTQLGVDVYLGEGRFTGDDSLEVDGRTLRFARAVIATGARASAPPVPGLEQVPYLTNETLFSLTRLPASLGILGAGPIGCEMAQAFARFGSRVTLIETEHGVLPREDREAAALVQRSLEQDGVEVLCCGRSVRAAARENGVALDVTSHDDPRTLEVEQLLVAAGRAPNVESLQLEAAGVAFDKKGIEVDERLRTTNRRVYAAGDVCSRFQFTHAADFMARTVIQNALFLGRSKVGKLVIPWCTYTEPELAHVGWSPQNEEESSLVVDTWTQPLAEVDRAVLDGQETGFVKVHTRKGTDRIVGATVVSERAGDLIGEISLAMTHGVGLKQVARAIHPYPTQADAFRKTGDLYNRSRLTPRVRKLMEMWLRWRR